MKLATFSAVLMSALAVGCATPPGTAESDPPKAQAPLAEDEYAVEGSMTSVAWVFGFRVGGGTVNFKGQKYDFALTGIDFLSAGVAGGPFRGTVKNLKKIEDLEGSYNVAQAGIAYGVGGGGIVLSNEKGVTLRLTSAEVGVEVRAGGGPLTIRLKR